MVIKRNVMINRAGGTAGRDSVNYRISIPAKMIRILGVTETDKLVTLTEEDGKIIITKKKKLTIHEKCNTCPYRNKYIDCEMEEAKASYIETGSSWRFECQASYYPPGRDHDMCDIMPPLSKCERDKMINKE